MKKPICVSKELYRSSAPESPEDLYEIRKLGIRTIICLQEGWSWLFRQRWNGAEEVWEDQYGDYLKFSLSNFFPPTKDECVLITDMIIEAQTRGGVLVHCRAGVDRTGFIIAFYNVRFNGFTTEGR